MFKFPTELTKKMVKEIENDFFKFYFSNTDFSVTILNQNMKFRNTLITFFSREACLIFLI